MEGQDKKKIGGTRQKVEGLDKSIDKSGGSR